MLNMEDKLSSSNTEHTNMSGSVDIQAENDEEMKKYLPTLIFLVIVMLFGILGNACVAVVYKLKFKRSSARVYIISLALADMSVCVVGMPYHIYDLTHLYTYRSVITCKTLSYLIGSCTLSSVFILLVVGLDRYLKVCRPLKRQIVDFGDRKACVIAVCFAVVLSLPYVIIYGHSNVPVNKDDYNFNASECFLDDIYTTAYDSYVGFGYLGFNCLLFVGSVVYVIVIYGLICRTIQQNGQLAIALNTPVLRCFCCKVEPDDDDDSEYSVQHRITSLDERNEEQHSNEPETSKKTPHFELFLHKDNLSTNTNATSKKSDFLRRNTTPNPALRWSSNNLVRHTMAGANVKERNSHKITMMMLTITVVFIVTYLPYITISVLDAVDDDFWNRLPDAQVVFFDLMLRIYVVNNVANPFIYSFWDAKFRRELGQLFWCNSKSQSKNRRTNTRCNKATKHTGTETNAK